MSETPSSFGTQRALGTRMALGTLIVALVSAPLSGAHAAGGEDRATARELAQAGIAAEERGDCPGAIDKLERAEQLFHAPPHVQHLARCYTKVGRLVDAGEAWRRLTLENLPANAPNAFKAAVEEAQQELPKIEPRLARLTLTTAAPYPGLKVSLDERVFPNAALDTPRVIDPGTHKVRASIEGRPTFEREITVAEGGREAITIDLGPGAPNAPDPSTGGPEQGADSTPTTKSSPWKTVGLVTAGVGGALLVGSAITWTLASGKESDRNELCPNQTCSSRERAAEAQQLADDISSLDTMTNVFLIGGGVLVAAGVTTFLVAPSKKGAGATSFILKPTIRNDFTGGHLQLSASF